MEKKEVNLYFVLAGAVSAGTYTAGVLDLLMEKIDAYSKDENASYNIKIRGIAGASAGGMCGSIFLRSNYGAQDWNSNPHKELLKSTWVNEITLEALATTDDIKDGNVYSLLNGNVLKNISNSILSDVAIASTPKIPSFIGDDFELILSVTDTKGLSYAIPFINDEGASSYFLTNHRNYYRFSLNEIPGRSTNVLKTKEAWNMLNSVSLGTGAFPLGFPPIKLERNVVKEDTLEFETDAEEIGVEPMSGLGSKYSFLGIDGGTVDNEPLNQVMDMIHHRKTKNDTEIHKVIFIDPFPTIDKKYNEELELGDQFGRLYSVLRNQSTFKIDEIKEYFKKYRNDCFKVAPTRKDTAQEDLQLAGGAFMAFGGFTHESFRKFDYQLGRRNCQKFLLSHFKINDEILLDVTGDRKEEELDWPKITKREFKKAGRPLRRRMSIVLRNVVGGFNGFAVSLFVKSKPTKMLFKSLEVADLIK